MTDKEKEAMEERENKAPTAFAGTERPEMEHEDLKDLSAPASKEGLSGKPAEDAGEERDRERLEEEVARLEAELKEATDKCREYLDDLQRLQAEFENYRKRMLREQTRIIEQANRGLVAKLLPVVDNLEMALKYSEGREDRLAEGVRMVYEQLMKLLRDEGLEEINPEGHPFDPNVCEAMMTVVSEDHEDETVVEVHQKGYKFKGSLLRPARATVSKCEGKADGEQG